MSKNRYTWIQDSVVEDDSNKWVKGYEITYHNQGTNIVKVGEDILLPDDRISLQPPAGGGTIEKAIRIKFLAALPLAAPLAVYPQLSQGNRLVITEVKKIGEDG